MGRPRTGQEGTRTTNLEARIVVTVATEAGIQSRARESPGGGSSEGFIKVGEAKKWNINKDKECLFGIAPRLLRTDQRAHGYPTQRARAAAAARAKSTS